MSSLRKSSWFAVQLGLRPLHLRLTARHLGLQRGEPVPGAPEGRLARTPPWPRAARAAAWRLERRSASIWATASSNSRASYSARTLPWVTGSPRSTSSCDDRARLLGLAPRSPPRRRGSPPSPRSAAPSRASARATLMGERLDGCRAGRPWRGLGRGGLWASDLPHAPRRGRRAAEHRASLSDSVGHGASQCTPGGGWAASPRRRPRRVVPYAGDGDPAHPDDACRLRAPAEPSWTGSSRSSVPPSRRPSRRRGPTATSRENAEYHAAREKQGMTEARIADLEGKLASAEVIDPPTSGRPRHLRLHGAARGRGRQGDRLPDRGLGGVRSRARPHLGAGAARPHAHRQEGGRHGDRPASRRQEDLRDPRGQLPLAGGRAANDPRRRR